jgi:hypothetical protein
MTTPSWAWALWILLFVVLEGIGLWDGRKGGTFSELIWAVFRVHDRRPTALTWALRAVLLGGLVWLVGHLGFGWWTL